MSIAGEKYSTKGEAYFIFERGVSSRRMGVFSEWKGQAISLLLWKGGEGFLNQI